MKPTIAMPQIPIYLKTSADMPRPQDPEFYWFTRSGLFLCRNYPFFQSDSPAQRMPGSLAAHQPVCRAAFPLLGAAALEYAVGFLMRFISGTVRKRSCSCFGTSGATATGYACRRSGPVSGKRPAACPARSMWPMKSPCRCRATTY